MIREISDFAKQAHIALMGARDDAAALAQTFFARANSLSPTYRNGTGKAEHERLLKKAREARELQENLSTATIRLDTFFHEAHPSTRLEQVPFPQPCLMPVEKWADMIAGLR